MLKENMTKPKYTADKWMYQQQEQYLARSKAWEDKLMQIHNNLPDLCRRIREGRKEIARKEALRKLKNATHLRP
jgi:hypothetical protein